MKTNILIHTVALCFILFEGSAKASLTDALSKYCVPVNASICTGETKATYNSAKNTCECTSKELYYNPKNRACEKCIPGSQASADFKTCEPLACPIGFEPVLVTKEPCPKGYELVLVKNGACPTGYNLVSLKKADYPEEYDLQQLLNKK